MKKTPQKNFLIPTVIVQAICLLMTVPLVWSLLFSDSLPNLVHESGEVSERLILLTLLCTPLFIIFGWTLPVRYRRTLGVYSFVALAVHVLARMAQQGYTLQTLFENISMTIGTIGLAIMIALTATSLDSIKRAMGRAWKRLHYGVYAVAILMEIHVLFLEFPSLEPHGIFFGVIVFGLLAVRLPLIRNRLQARWQKKPFRL
jgi:sulfoxide reductase heme-binding subunit YedZ